MLESFTKILLEKEMSKPSVLGLVAGESMDIWENVAPMHLLTDTWLFGLLVILMLLTLRSLQEWKCKTCTIIKKNVTICPQSLYNINLGLILSKTD
jgi:hypothetical protein